MSGPLETRPEFWDTEPMHPKLAPDIQQELDRIVDTIVSKFDPEKIILFGSHAWGTPHRDSDVDLFIVKDEEDTQQLAYQIDGALLDRRVPLDLLVYRPERIQWRLSIDDPFIRKVFSHGKVLYDGRRSACV